MTMRNFMTLCASLHHAMPKHLSTSETPLHVALFLLYNTIAFAPAALASPWLTRAHHIVSSHPVAPAAIYRCHQHHRLSPITTRLSLAHITAPPPPTQGDGLVFININPPVCTTLPPTFILIKTTPSQTISSALPVSLPLVLLNKRSRPRRDTLQ